MFKIIFKFFEDGPLDRYYPMMGTDRLFWYDGVTRRDVAWGRINPNIFTRYRRDRFLSDQFVKSVIKKNRFNVDGDGSKSPEAVHNNSDKGRKTNELI